VAVDEGDWLDEVDAHASIDGRWWTESPDFAGGLLRRQVVGLS
jgi:hypothetical protein